MNGERAVSIHLRVRGVENVIHALQIEAMLEQLAGAAYTFDERSRGQSSSEMGRSRQQGAASRLDNASGQLSEPALGQRAKDGRPYGLV